MATRREGRLYRACTTCRSAKKPCIREHGYEACNTCKMSGCVCLTPVKNWKWVLKKVPEFMRQGLLVVQILVFEGEFWKLVWVNSNSPLKLEKASDQLSVDDGEPLRHVLINHMLDDEKKTTLRFDLVVNNQHVVNAQAIKGPNFEPATLVLIWDPHTAAEVPPKSRKRSRASSVVAPETSFPQAYLDCGIHSPTELAEYDEQGCALLRKYQACREWKKVKNLYARQHGAKIYKHKDGTVCIQAWHALPPQEYLDQLFTKLNGYSNAVISVRLSPIDKTHFVNAFNSLFVKEYQILTVQPVNDGLQTWRLDSEQAFAASTLTQIGVKTLVSQYWNTGLKRLPAAFKRIMYRLVISMLNLESAQESMISTPDTIHPIFNYFDIHTPDELVVHDLHARQTISDVLGLTGWTLSKQTEVFESFKHSSSGWLKYAMVLPISAEEALDAGVTHSIASEYVVQSMEKIDGRHHVQTVTVFLSGFGKQLQVKKTQRLVTRFSEETEFLSWSYAETGFLVKSMFTRFVRRTQGCVLEVYILPKNKVTRKMIKYMSEKHAEKTYLFYTTLPTGNETVTSYLDTLKYVSMEALRTAHYSWVFDQEHDERREVVLLSALTIGRAFQLATRSAEAGRFSMDACTMMQPQHELVVQTGASLVIHDYETKVNRKIWFNAESMLLFSQGENIDSWLFRVTKCINETENIMLYQEQGTIAIFLHYLLSEPTTDQPDVEELHELQCLVWAHWMAQECRDKYSLPGNLPPPPTLGTSMVAFIQDLLIIFQQDQLGLEYINTRVPRPLEMPSSLRFTALEDAFHRRIHLEDHQPFLDRIIAPMQCRLQLVQGSLHENQDPTVGPCVLETEPSSTLALTKQDHVFYLHFNHGLLEAKLRLDGSRTIFTATDGTSSCARAFFDPDIAPHPILWTRNDTWSLILTPEPSWQDLETLRGTRSSVNGQDTLVWEVILETPENSIKNTSSSESFGSFDGF